MVATSAKETLRATVLERVAVLPHQERRDRSAQAVRQLRELPIFQDSRVIALYLSFGMEVDTDTLVIESLWSGKVVAVPVFDPAGPPVLSRLHSLGDLVPGPRGVRQPHPGRIMGVPTDELDLIVVPGVAFDRRGGRLGRGLGWYDRLLANGGEGLPIVALAFSCQIVPEVPVEPGDIRVERIVTEDEVIECAA